LGKTFERTGESDPQDFCGQENCVCGAKNFGGNAHAHANTDSVAKIPLSQQIAATPRYGCGGSIVTAMAYINPSASIVVFKKTSSPRV